LEEETLAAHQTRGDLLIACDCTDQAAEEYLKGGTIAVRANDPSKGIPVLRRALELAPWLQAAHWQLAEALRLASYRPSSQQDGQTPKDAVALIQEAAQIWDQAAERALPDADYHWAYTARASICQLQATLGDGDFYQRCWNGVALLEFGTLVNDKDVFRWGSLSRLLSWLNLDVCAVQASAEAAKIDPANNIAI
jgi:hypothetical protein